MTRKLAGFGLAFALAELAAAYLPPLASLLTAALFISLFLFAAFTQRRAARFALPAVAGLLAGLVWSAAYQLAVVKPAQSLAGQTYACTAIVQPDAETSWQPGNVRATLLITRLDGRKTSLKVYCTDLPYSEAGDIITGQFQLQPLRADSYRMSRYAKGTWLGASYQADYLAGNLGCAAVPAVPPAAGVCQTVNHLLATKSCRGGSCHAAGREKRTDGRME
mgnify:CR=1 FL=1